MGTREKTPEKITLGEALDRAKMTQAELSRKVGRGEAQISQYVLGHRSPQQHNREAIAAAVNVPVEGIAWPEK